MQLATGNMELQQLAAEAKENIKKTWEGLLHKAQVPDRSAPLEVGKYDGKKDDGKTKIVFEKKGLSDPEHPAVFLCVYIYQMENFAYAELNRSCRYKDELKVPTLGPWAMALNFIITGAQQHRSVSSEFDCNK